MRIVDLSQPIFHRMQTHPNHVPVIISQWGSHANKRVEDGYEFSSDTFSISFSDHSGTHVDAPRHFDASPSALSVDQMPLENFYTEAVCLDLSHIPLKTDILVKDLEAAENKAGVQIKPRDTVLLYTGFYERTHGTPAFITDFSGLTKESAEWLGRKHIVSFGVEAMSPGRPGKINFQVHHVCRDMGFTHMEGLVNLDKLVGKGRFTFIGFPLKIQGASGSPIRAVAILDN